MAVEWDAFTAGDPGVMKQAQDFKLLTDNISTNNTVSNLYATFRTDISNTQQTQSISSGSVTWGSPWGAFVWGGISDTYDSRTYVPQAQSYFRVMNPGVTHSNAKERISINGYSLKFKGISERTTR
jgi:hypothetical protein